MYIMPPMYFSFVIFRLEWPKAARIYLRLVLYCKSQGAFAVAVADATA